MPSACMHSTYHVSSTHGSCGVHRSFGDDGVLFRSLSWLYVAGFMGPRNPNLRDCVMEAPQRKAARQASSRGTVAGHENASALVSESTPTGATIPGRRAERKRPLPSPQDAPNGAASAGTSGSAGEYDADRLHDDQGWEHAGTVAADCGQPSPATEKGLGVRRRRG